MRSVMKEVLKRTSLPIGMTLAVLATATPTAAAQTVRFDTVSDARRVDLYFYHGAGNSTLIREGDSPGYARDGRKQVHMKLPQKSQVCLTIVNAHPADYTYGLSLTVDTVTPKLPA